MTSKPFKRLALPIAIIATIGLGACDVEDASTIPTSPPQETITPAEDADIITNLGGDLIEDSYPKFDPLDGIVPLPSDLLFANAATTDGTAQTADTTPPVTTAINDMDGWSTNAQFDIAFEGDIDDATIIDTADIAAAGSVSPAAVLAATAGQNVFLLKLNTGTSDALDPANVNQAAPFGAPAFDAPAFRAEAISVDGGSNNALRITPLAPLDAKSKYIVFITSGIEDSDGDKIGPSEAYNIYGDTTKTLSGISNINAVQSAIRGWEQLGVGYLAARNATLNASLPPGSELPVLPAGALALQSSITFSGTFTTTDPKLPLMAMAAPISTIAGSQVKAGIDPMIAASNAMNINALGILSTPKARALGFFDVNPATAGTVDGLDVNPLSGGALAAGVANLYTGHITTPYYLTAPSNAADATFVTKGWTASDTIAGALGQPSAPQDEEAGGAASANTNITYRFPFAQSTSMQTIPLQVTLPSHIGCAGAAPYKTVIYIHGITSDRSSVLALAHTLAAPPAGPGAPGCVATVAIDLPMHGIPANSALLPALSVDHAPALQSAANLVNANERHFEFKQSPTGTTVPMVFPSSDASDGSGTLFINLSTFINTRDNMKQAVMDLLNLNASLADIDINNDMNPDLDVNNVYVVGVSLGGIIGTTFTSINEAARTQEGSVGHSSDLNPIKGFVASAAGGQLSKLLENSPAFAPKLLGGLAAQGVTQGSSNLEKFFYVYQGIVDSADPINFASSLTVPTLFQEISGDKVVPNNATDTTLVAPPFNNRVSTSPLAGTDPLRNIAGATKAACAPSPNDTTAPKYVLINDGHHASLLRPNEDSAAPMPTANELNATREMQTQVATFINNPTQAIIGAGAASAVTDSCMAPPPPP